MRGGGSRDGAGRPLGQRSSLAASGLRPAPLSNSAPKVFYRLAQSADVAEQPVVFFFQVVQFLFGRKSRPIVFDIAPRAHFRRPSVHDDAHGRPPGSVSANRARRRRRGRPARDVPRPASPVRRWPKQPGRPNPRNPEPILRRICPAVALDAAPRRLWRRRARPRSTSAPPRRPQRWNRSEGLLATSRPRLQPWLALDSVTFGFFRMPCARQLWILLRPWSVGAAQASHLGIRAHRRRFKPGCCKLRVDLTLCGRCANIVVYIRVGTWAAYDIGAETGCTGLSCLMLRKTNRGW